MRNGQRERLPYRRFTPTFGTTLIMSDLLLTIGVVVAGVVASAALGWLPAPQILRSHPRKAWLAATTAVVLLVALTVVIRVREPDSRRESPTPTASSPAASGSPAAYLIESSIGLSNVTAGATQYDSHIRAKVGDTIQAQVFVRNREVDVDIEQLRIKISVSEEATPSQALTSRATCSHCFTVTDSASVAADVPIRLEVVPGSTNWRSGGPDGSQFDHRDTDAVVTSPDGALWGQLAADVPGDSLTVITRFRVVHA